MMLSEEICTLLSNDAVVLLAQTCTAFRDVARARRTDTRNLVYSAIGGDCDARQFRAAREHSSVMCDLHETHVRAKLDAMRPYLGEYVDVESDEEHDLDDDDFVPCHWADNCLIFGSRASDDHDTKDSQLLMRDLDAAIAWIFYDNLGYSAFALLETLIDRGLLIGPSA